MDRLLSTAMKSIRAIGDCGEGGNKKKEYLLFSSLFFHFFFFFFLGIWWISCRLCQANKQRLRCWKFRHGSSQRIDGSRSNPVHAFAQGDF